MSAREVIAAQYADTKRARADAKRLLGSLSKLKSSLVHVEHRNRVRAVLSLLDEEVKYLVQRLGRADVESPVREE